MNKVNTSQYEFLVESNQRLVYKIARRFKVSSFDYDDLVQAGMMGLFNAAKNYDVTKGTKFSTYATYYIIGAIKDELEKRSLIKTSKYYKNLTSSKEETIDQADSLVAKEYYQVELKEDMNDIAGNYLNLDAFNFTAMEKELLKLRLENRYSQVEIAKELSISQSKVSRMLKEMREKITITK